MFHNNKKAHIEKPINIEREAEKIYQYIKKHDQQIERVKNRVHWFDHSDHTEDIISAAEYHMEIVDRYLDDVLEKDNAMEVMEKVKQMAEQKKKEVNHNYKLSSRAADVHDFVLSSAQRAIDRKQFYQILVEI